MPHKNPEDAKRRKKAYLIENKEQIAVRRKARYDEAKAAGIFIHRDRYKARRKEILARQKEWRQTQIGWSKYTISSLRHRARELGVEFTLTLDDFASLPNTCPVLNIPVSLTDGLSVDRIDNTLGYVPTNICFMSDRANRIKRDATLDELILLGEWAKGMKANAVNQQVETSGTHSESYCE